MSIKAAKTLEPGALPVCLTKRDHGFLEVILDWQAPIDLDLAVMWEDFEGNRKVVQALGKDPKRFGRFGKPPYIKLNRDDRSGGQEIVTVNMARIHLLKRFLVFAYVWDGTLNGLNDATVTIKHPDPNEETHIINLGQGSGMSCVLVHFETLPNGDTVFHRVVKFFRGHHLEIDKHYGWNVDWSEPERKE